MRISKKGFYVAATGGVLRRSSRRRPQPPAEGAPTIPKKADGDATTTPRSPSKMVEIKKAFPDRDEGHRRGAKATFRTRCWSRRWTRSARRRRDRKLLFPDVTLGAMLMPAPEAASPELDDRDAEDVQRMRFRKALARKKRKEREAAGEIKELNITAMMDMMTIILVFLLKSYAASSVTDDRIGRHQAAHLHHPR